MNGQNNFFSARPVEKFFPNPLAQKKKYYFFDLIDPVFFKTLNNVLINGVKIFWAYSSASSIEGLKAYNFENLELSPMLLPYRNQSIDMQRKSLDWFLYDDNIGF